MKVEIYSDGSSDGKSGGKCGWAFVICIDGLQVKEGSGSIACGTNNVGELQAAIEGLQYVSCDASLGKEKEVILISDSQLVLRYATGEYKCKAWHLIPYYIKLRDLYKKVGATTRWERGHIGEPNNERCDALAKAARVKVDDEEN